MNHLSTTIEVLDLLVPLEAPDRLRVLRAVQAVVDMTEEYGGLRSSSEDPVVTVASASVSPVRHIVSKTFEAVASPAPKEKPRHAAPKAKPRHRGPQQSADRVRWMTEVPKLLKDKGPMALREIRQQLKVEKDSTLSVVMKALRDSGVVQALGENHLTRVYRLAQ